jgi:hypothetical protein
MKIKRKYEDVVDILGRGWGVLSAVYLLWV